MTPVISKLTVGQTDLLATKMLQHCGRAGVVSPAPTVSWPEFHRLRARLYETFDVPDTTLTPLAARVLYGLAMLRRPMNVAVLGCYVGNLMAWVTAPGFGPDGGYEGRRAIGVDVDGAAVATAQGNFHRAGYSSGLRVRHGDAFDADSFAADGPWDLLLVDIDVPGARKSGYARLVQRWAPYLAPGALVVAHDVAHPVFAWDLRLFGDFMRGNGARLSVTLPVDECGLEVSVWGGEPGDTP